MNFVIRNFELFREIWYTTSYCEIEHYEISHPPSNIPSGISFLEDVKFRDTKFRKNFPTFANNVFEILSDFYEISHSFYISVTKHVSDCKET
jgi:hypothetical protein